MALLDTEIPQLPAVTEENSRITRHAWLPFYFSSKLAAVVAIFCYGLLLGAAGGLLLGRTAVIVLQSLELLADNELLMDHLDNYIKDNKENDLSVAERIGIPQTADSETMFNAFISLLAEEFGVLSATFSLALGIPAGVSTYQLVIETCGETEIGKALALAGPLCLMGVTATGYILGSAFEGFLSMTLTVMVWFFHSGLFIMYLLLCCHSCFDALAVIMFCFFSPLNTPLVLFLMLGIVPILKTKLILMVALISKNGCLLGNPFGFKLTIAPVPLMLIITDVFNFAQQPIVTLQSPTNTSSAVVEGVFVGVLTSQLLMVAVGMSLFASWQRGRAGKISLSAAGLGAAVVAVIESALPVLGPGPTIGALMGVAGTVGVSLSAAGVATDQYGQDVGQYELVGRLGLMIGAGVGAFLYSHTCSGLSGMFMGLCGASIPFGVYLKPGFLFRYKHVTGWKFKHFLRIVIIIFFSTWIYFTCANLGVLIGASLIVGPLVGLILICLMLRFCFIFELVAKTQQWSDPFSLGSKEPQKPIIVM